MLCKTDESWLQRGSEVVSAQDHEVKSIWKKKTSKSISCGFLFEKLVSQIIKRVFL